MNFALHSRKEINFNPHFVDKTSNHLQYLQAVITMRIQNEDAFNQKMCNNAGTSRTID